MNANLVLIVSVLLLLGFFSSDFSGNRGMTGAAVGQNIEIDGLTCKWKDESYEACMVIDWENVVGDYVKAYFTGGKGVDNALKKYDKKFLFCEDVGNKDGVKGGGVYVYDTKGKAVAVNKNLAVDCKKSKVSVEDTFTKKFNFRAWINAQSQGWYGNDEFTIELPREPVSCKLNGKWEVVYRRGWPQLSCKGAEGKIEAKISKLGLVSVNDPGYFRWAGGREPAMDYEKYETNGYAEMLLCDAFAGTYKGNNNNVKLTLEEFGKEMKFSWKYNNKDSGRPAMDVFLELSCDLEKVVEPKKIEFKKVPEKPVVEVPKPVAFSFDVEELDAVEEVGFWGKIGNFFIGLFY